MLIATAGATRITQDQAGDLHQDEPVDGTGCIYAPGITPAGHMGKCCTTKCNGMSDPQSEAKFSRCKVVMGKVSKHGNKYNCEEICTLTKGDITTKNVTVTRQGGLWWSYTCVSDDQ